ncbi:MAG TPA: hypothetical protein VIM69_07045, partial [Opitutaceae bacterium]
TWLNGWRLVERERFFSRRPDSGVLCSAHPRGEGKVFKTRQSSKTHLFVPSSQNPENFPVISPENFPNRVFNQSV